MNESKGGVDMDNNLTVPDDINSGDQPATGKPVWGQPRLAVSPDAVRSLPAEFARKHRVLPLEVRNGILRIATASPADQRVIDDIRLLTGLEVEEAEAPAAQVMEQIAECYQVTVERMIEDLGPGHGANGEGKN